MADETTQPSTLQKLPSREAGQALREVEQGLKTLGWAALPALQDVGFAALARWVYRQWMARWRRARDLSGQLVFIDPEHRQAAGDAPFWEIAQGGLLALPGCASPDELPRALQAAVADGGLLLLLDAPASAQAPPMQAPASWTRTLLRFDELHDICVDPALEHLRRSLLATCRGNTPVHLRGETSTGKRALARWAHATLDEEPLTVIRGDQGLPTAGRWSLFEEVTSLGPEQVRSLRDLLERMQAPPGPTVAGPVGKRPNHRAFDAIRGTSQALTVVLHLILGLARSPLSVLLQGEPGVGKESLARAVHEISGRKGAFVALDMGALSETLAESELFGHVKGAFTGADRDRPGAFRAAQGGTLFLDEIGNLSPSLQMRLLRVLQERQVTPLGSDQPVSVDTRVVAATNADLRLMVMQGRFRQDLLGRLNAATVRVPPLRERIGDLEELAMAILEGQGLRREAPLFTPEAEELLRSYSWPGNVRELGNVVGYAAALAPDPDRPIEAEHLGPLSPKNQRPTPLITTHSGSTEAALDGLDGTPRRLLTLTTLSVPPLRERSRLSRRQAILAALPGRAITTGALEILEDAPWYGNSLELEHRLRPLLAAPPGLLDGPDVRACLPDLFAAVGHAPIRVLLSPTRQFSGEVGGLTYEIDAAGLLIGRVRHLDELRRAGRDPRVATWLGAIDRATGGVSPACLDLGLLGRLSRAHLLITRDADGLVLHLMPGTNLVALAGSLDEGLEELRAGTPFSVGPAAEVTLTSTRGNLYLQLFAFTGAVAFDQYGDLALRRAEARRNQAGPTLLTQATRGAGSGAGSGDHGSPGASPDADKTRHRVWELEEAEIQALVDLVASYRAGQFSRHVLTSLSALRDRPACARLVEYLDDAPRKAQYLCRLFEKDENEALRRALCERFAALPDGTDRQANLPAGLQRVLAQPVQ